MSIIVDEQFYYKWSSAIIVKLLSLNVLKSGIMFVIDKQILVSFSAYEHFMYSSFPKGEC